MPRGTRGHLLGGTVPGGRPKLRWGRSYRRYRPAGHRDAVKTIVVIFILALITIAAAFYLDVELRSGPIEGTAAYPWPSSDQGGSTLVR